MKKNKTVKPKKPLRRVPNGKKVNHKTEIEKIKNLLKELREGFDRFNGLLLTHMKNKTCLNTQQ